MIRSAAPGDAQAIRSLMQSVPGFWKPAWPEDVIERALHAAEGLAFVWEVEGRLHGFVCAQDCGFRGYLSELVVAPQAQRAGIGRQLLAAVERELKLRGCSVLISDVWRDAEHFYRAQGWTSPDAVLLCRRFNQQ